MSASFDNRHLLILVSYFLGFQLMYSGAALRESTAAHPEQAAKRSLLLCCRQRESFQKQPGARLFCKTRNLSQLPGFLCQQIHLLICTGKSLSEAFIFASTNPQYDDILFIELQVQYVKIPSSEHGENMLCTEIDFDIQNNLCTQHVHNMFSHVLQK